MLGVPGIPEMTGVPGPDPRAKGLKDLGELNNVLSKLGEGGRGGGGGYNLSRCLINNPLLIFTKTKHNYVTQICLYP